MSLLALREVVVGFAAPRPTRRVPAPREPRLRVLGISVRPGSRAERVLILADRHRLWLYVGATLALLMLIVVSSAMRANAIDAGAVPSAKDFYCALNTSGCAPGNGVSKYDSLQDACRYLTFCRWQEINGVSSPQVSASTGISAIPAVGMTVIARLMLTLASVVMFVVGFLLVQAMQINIIDQVAVTVDYLFAVVGSKLLWGDVAASPMHAIGAFSLIIVGVTVYALVLLANPFSGRFHPSPRRPVMLVVRVLAGIVLFAAMTHAAMQNHSGFGTSNLSKIGQLDRQGSILNSVSIANNGEKGTAASPGKMDSWSMLSPGWFIAGMHEASQIVISAISSLTSAMDSAAGTGVTGNLASDSGCGRYISAMHTIYTQAPPGSAYRAGSADVLVKYDQLMGSLYFTPYRMAAYGDSIGGQNAWCRVAEQQVGAPVGDQVFISQQAKLYSEVTNSVTSTERTWKYDDPGAAVARASNFFGPNFLDASARRRSQNFFAACVWTAGGTVSINEADKWNSVLKFNDPDDADGGPSVFGWKPFAGAIKNFQDMFTADADKYLSTATCKTVVDSPLGFASAEDQTSTQEASGNTYPSYPFNYRESSGNSGVFSVLGIGDSSSLPYFAPANTIAGGDSGAYDFYRNASGLNSGWAAVLGFMSLVFAAMVGKYVLPFIVGGLIAQFVDLVAMVLLVFVVFLYIIPIEYTRRLVVMTVKTVGWAFLVNAVFIGALSVMLLMTNIARALLYSADAPAFVALMQLAGSTLLAFIATKMFLRRVLGFDTHSLAAATRSASQMSLQSVAARVGVGDPPPHLFREWRGAAGKTGEMLRAERKAKGHVDEGLGMGGSSGAPATGDAAEAIIKKNHDKKGEQPTASPSGPPVSAPGAGPNSPLTPQRPSKPHRLGDVAGVAAASAVAAVASGGTSLVPEAAVAGEMGLAAAVRATGAAAGKVALRGAARGATDHLKAMALEKGSSLPGGHAAAHLLRSLRSVADPKAGTGVNLPSTIPGGPAALPLNPMSEMTPQQAKTIAAGAPGVSSVSPAAPASRGEIRAALAALESLGSAARTSGALSALGHLGKGAVLPGGPKALGVGLADLSAQRTTALGAAGSVQPLGARDLARLSGQQRSDYLRGNLDALPVGSLPGDIVYTVDPRRGMGDGIARALAASGVRDPLTGALIPAAALTGAGAVTSTGDTVLGLRKTPSGLYLPDRQDIVPAAMLPSRVDGEPPAGVDRATWDDWKSLRTWMRSERLSPLNTDHTLWPAERRLQVERVTAGLPQIYAALGSPLRPADLSSVDHAGGLVSAGASPVGPMDGAAMSRYAQRLDDLSGAQVTYDPTGPQPLPGPSSPMALIPSPMQPPAQDTFDEAPLSLPSDVPMTRRQRRAAASRQEDPTQEMPTASQPYEEPEREPGRFLAAAPIRFEQQEPPRDRDGFREARPTMLSGFDSTSALLPSAPATSGFRSPLLSGNNARAMERLLQNHQEQIAYQVERSDLLAQAFTEAADAISMQASALPGVDIGQANLWARPEPMDPGPRTRSALVDPWVREEFPERMVQATPDLTVRDRTGGPRPEVAAWFDAVFEDQQARHGEEMEPLTPSVPNPVESATGLEWLEGPERPGAPSGPPRHARGRKDRSSSPLRPPSATGPSTMAPAPVPTSTPETDRNGAPDGGSSRG